MVVAWLPVELWIKIIENIFDPSSLLAFRLVNHAWDDIASKQLKQMAYLSVDPKSLDDTETRVSNRKARLSTKGMVVCLPNSDHFYFKDPCQPGTVTSSSNSKYQERLRRLLLEELPRFENLVHMAVHFRPPPKALGHHQASAFSQEHWIYHMVEDLFSTLGQFYNGLDELSLECLPVHARIPGSRRGSDLRQYAETLEVLQDLKLKSLKLGWVGPGVWPPSNAPIWKQYGSPNHWISPVKDTLRHLSISSWGFYTVEWIRFGPDGPDFHIPNLESLELRACTFTSEVGFKWILAHRGTLHSLKFDDCAILHCLQTSPDNPFISQTLAKKVEIKHGLKMGLCQLRWQEWFHKFRAGLPNLKNFQFGSSRIREPGEEGPVFESERVKGPRFGQKAKFLLGLFPDRYLEMKQDLKEAPWILDPPAETYKKRPQCDKADLVALQLLLKYTKQHTDENSTSDHAGYVENLLGRVKQRENE